MFGFLNVYKPKGKTSHDVVAVLRRITKIKQIGHTGTLDPFAEGVLPICIGKATRLIEYLNHDKAYIGTIQLGKSTTTYDIEGETVNTSDKTVSAFELEEAIEKFKGKILQKPPIYSALKVNGKKLYEYARKGEEIEIQPREVEIKEIRLVSFDEEMKVLDVYISCSKGTYIRSIANDLGEALGTYGFLARLVRVKAGDFGVDSSVPLEELMTEADVESKLLAPLDYLDYPKYELNDKEKDKVSHGMSIETNLKDGLAVLTSNDRLCAVGEIKNKQFKCSKVFI